MDKELYEQICFSLKEKSNELKEKIEKINPTQFVLNKDIVKIMEEIKTLSNKKREIEKEINNNGGESNE